MKVMTCHQLGGACDEPFQANTFDEIAQLSKQHAMQMLNKNDRAHLDEMHDMQKLMQQPEALQQWFEHKRQIFDHLPQI